MTRFYREVLAAEARIRSHVRQTPFVRALALDGRPYLKLENLQVTGSFKARGALNRLLLFTEEERRRGVLAASTGNHGLAFAHALAVLGMDGTIYLPETAQANKVAMLRQFGVALRFVGKDGVEAECAARLAAREQDKVFVSPYNDPAVIGGQGTVAVEMLRQLRGLDAIFAAVGGGGLIGGIAAYAKASRPGLRIVGCSPEASAVLHASVAAGRIVTLPTRPTLSDGTAGGVEDGAITFPLCRELVDDWLVVGEDAIRDAMRYLYRKEHLVVEGAAGVAVAAFLQQAGRYAGQNVGLVLCGGNVDMQQFAALVT